MIVKPLCSKVASSAFPSRVRDGELAGQTAGGLARDQRRGDQAHLVGWERLISDEHGQGDIELRVHIEVLMTPSLRQLWPRLFMRTAL